MIGVGEVGVGVLPTEARRGGGVGAIVGLVERLGDGGGGGEEHVQCWIVYHAVVAVGVFGEGWVGFSFHVDWKLRYLPVHVQFGIRLEQEYPSRSKHGHTDAVDFLSVSCACRLPMATPTRIVQYHIHIPPTCTLRPGAHENVLELHGPHVF